MMVIDAAVACVASAVGAFTGAAGAFWLNTKREEAKETRERVTTIQSTKVILASYRSALVTYRDNWLIPKDEHGKAVSFDETRMWKHLLPIAIAPTQPLALLELAFLAEIGCVGELRRLYARQGNLTSILDRIRRYSDHREELKPPATGSREEQVRLLIEEKVLQDLAFPLIKEIPNEIENIDLDLSALNEVEKSLVAVHRSGIGLKKRTVGAICLALGIGAGSCIWWGVGRITTARSRESPWNSTAVTATFD